MDLNYVIDINQLKLKSSNLDSLSCERSVPKYRRLGAADFQPDEVIPAEKSFSKTESVELGKPGRYIFHTLT